MNLVLIRDGIKLKLPLELDPTNDPSDEVSALQEIVERLGFNDYYLEDANPVRTKDLTDDEINELVYRYAGWELARAVIAADRNKNR